MARLSDWNKIQQSREYWDYSPEDRAIIKTQWFKENIAPTQEFQSYGDEDKSIIERAFLKPEEYVGYDRGFLGDVASRAARGGVGLIEAVGGAMRMADIDPTKEEGLIPETGKKVTDFAETAREKHDFLKPDIAEATGKEGWLKRGFGGAVESAAPSLAPLAGGIAGAKVGGLIGSAFGPVGAGAGAIIGGSIGGLGTLFATFGLGQYQTTYDETIKELQAKGIPQAEAEQKAGRNALISATAEAGGELAGDVAALFFFGVFGKQAIGQPLKQTIRQLMQTGKKDFAKAVAKTIPFETGSEMGTAYFQATAAQEAGISTLPPQEAVAEAIVPAIFLSLFFGSGVHGMNVLQAKKLYQDLNDENPETRFEAVKAVASRMKDPEDARQWMQTASSYIQSGQPIPLDRPIVDFAIQKQDQETAGATVRKSAMDRISTATNVDEAVKAFEEATAPDYEPLGAGMRGSPFAATALREDLALQEAEGRAPGLIASESARAFQWDQWQRVNQIRKAVAQATPEEEDKIIEEAKREGARFGLDPEWVNQAIIDGMTAKGAWEAGYAERGRGQAEEAGRKEGVQGRPGEEVRLRDDEQAGAPGVRDEAKAEEVRGLINDAATEAATSPENDLPEPTEKQIEAGNYRKGHISLHGLDISIENPVGSTREGVSKEGKPWKTEMKSHYGYIRGTKGKDKDHLDVFIGPYPESEFVTIINQVNPETGDFDEHKIMLGYLDEASAQVGYLSNYEPGWKGLGSAKSMDILEFKDWVEEGDTTKSFGQPKKAEIPTAEGQAPIAPTKKGPTVAQPTAEGEKVAPRGDLEVEAPVKAKEPWEMTLDEWLEAGGKYQEGFTGVHFAAVQQALSEGKPVPAEVLKDYPHLRKETPDVEKEEGVRKEEKAQRAEEREREEVAAKKPPEGREAQLEKLQKDLERKGAGTIGAVHYQIREREDLPPGKGYYFRRTEGGNRQDVGTTNYGMWDMNQAVYNAMENAKDVKIEPGPAQEERGDENARWEAVGALSGGKVKQTEERGYVFVFGEMTEEARQTLIGVGANSYGIGRLKEKGITIRKGEPKPELKASEATAEDLLAMWDEEAAKVEGEKTPEKPTISFTIKTSLEDFNRKNFENLSYVGKLVSREEQPNGWLKLTYEKIGEKPVTAQVQKEKPKEEPKEELEAKFKEGDRVILKDVYNQDMDGRHGTVSKVDVSTFYMTPVLAGRTTKQVDIRYDVKTDAGTVARMVSPDKISAETGQAPAVTQDVEINPGEFMSPIRLLADIRQKREYARGQKAKAQRAKKNTQINKYKQTASDYDRAADELQAKYDEWAAKNKPGEQKPAAKAPVTGTLDDYGLKVTKTTTKNGTPVWQVSGNTKEHSEHIKAAGGRWYGPKKVWSFYNSDPTQDILSRLIDYRQSHGLELPKKETAKAEEEKPTKLEEKRKETVDHVKNAIDKFKEINKILGEEGGISGAEVDQSKYDLIKPLLKEAWDELVAAGKSAHEFVLLALQTLSPKGRPYFEKFVREEVANEPADTGRREQGEGAPEAGTRGARREEPGPVPTTEEVGGTEGVRGEPGKGTDVGVPPGVERRPVVSPAGEELQGQPPGTDRGVRGKPPEAVGRDTGNVPGISVSGSDYVIPQGGLDRKGGWKTAAKNNLDAIELYKKITSENRPATPEEQKTLVKYVGWGASELANNMFPSYAYFRQVDPDNAKDDWKPLVERLVSLLTEEEIKTAAKSTQYAHYTSEKVIRSIYKALEKLGFKGGRMLEPGSGIAHFVGLIPESMRKDSLYTGIEMDGVSAGIAKLLYPTHNLIHGDYTQTLLPRDFFDAAIGNPPFAKTQILVDPEYRKQRFSLHNYFFAKSMDRVRPGGVLVFVTSHFTMDAQSKKIRNYLSKSADLIGAVRLPQTAFKQNAGTEVVTDVLFFKKRVKGEVPAGETWVDLAEVETPEGKVLVNEYFANHPEMVLGRHSLQGSMRKSDEYTVLPAEGDIEDLFDKAVEKLPAGVYSTNTETSENVKRNTFERDFNPKNKKEGGIYLSDNGKLQIVDAGSGVDIAAVKPKLTPQEKTWLKDYVPLRDAVKQTHYDQLTDGDWESSLKTLQAAYRKFTKKHGKISEFTTHTRTVKDEDGNPQEVTYRRGKYDKLLRVDAEGSIVNALEKITENGDIIESPALSQRTIRKPEEPIIETVSDALAVSLNEKGQLDLAHIGNLLNMRREEIISKLGDLIYKGPSRDYVMADEYLSGNVVRKLDEAMEAARVDPSYERNVEALKKVQPDPLGPKDITSGLGATWIPVKYLNEFGTEVLDLRDCKVQYFAASNSWIVTGSFRPQGRRGGGQEYGTADRGPNELLEAALNSRPVRISRTDPETKKTYTDEAATTAANEKLKLLKQKFASWVWTDGDRATDLLKIYNREFNNLAPRRFDGSHLTLPGASALIKLYDHQKRAIWRIIQTGNNYLAHSVGAGKTFVMIAAGMEMRRLGMISKPLYVVPKHMLGQFAREFNELYPTAHVMVADEENFHTENRRRFVAQATLNNPDAIIVPHSSFGLFSLKEETVAPIRDAFIQELQYAWQEMRDEDQPYYLIKQIEARIDQAEQRFNSMIASGDKAITFEEMGVDYLFLDEAHEFRKLDYVTNQRIKGIDPVGSKRAADLYIKTIWLENQNPGRSHTFASGTPITNTLGELYTVMRFFDPKGMEEAGIDHFDSWAAMFAQAAIGWEKNAAGNYQPVERFSEFINIPELMSRVRMFMDVLTMSQLGAKITLPEVQGSRPEIVITQPIPELKDYQQNVLQPRIDASLKWKPSPSEKGNPDPLINIITDGRLAGIDMRFVSPHAKANKDSKLNRYIDGIIETYFATKDNEYLDINGSKSPIKGGVQVCFFNTGYGEMVAERRGFSAKEWTINRLKAAKIPLKDVAWIDEAKNAQQKEALFKDLRMGKKRILFGSAKKMGTGMNIQNRLTHLHYLDAPWYPADVEQPLGRIIRQGNQNKVVDIRWYATEGSYDATMWKMVSRKSKAIEKAFTGDKNLRKMDDLSEASQYEMASALASGDERIIQLASLQAQVDKFSRLYEEYENNKQRFKWKINEKEDDVKNWGERLEKLKRMSKHVPKGWIAFEEGEIDGNKYDKREQFNDAMLAKINKREGLSEKNEVLVGKLNGFSIYQTVTKRGVNEDKTTGDKTPWFNAEINLRFEKGLDEAWSPYEVTAAKMLRFLDGIESKIREHEQDIENVKEEIQELRRKLAAPFEYEREYADAIAESAQLESELRDEGKKLEEEALSKMTEDEANENRTRLIKSFMRDLAHVAADNSQEYETTLNAYLLDTVASRYVEKAYDQALELFLEEKIKVGEIEEQLEDLKSKYLARETYLDYPAIIGKYPDFESRVSGETVETEAELSTLRTKGTPVKILEGHVRRLQRNAKGAAPTTVLRNLKDLPKNILGKVPPSYFAENQVIRALHVRIRETGKTEVFLFSDNIPNLAEATKSWVHEQFGHQGIRLVLTEEQHRQFMRNVYFAKQKQIDPLAKQYGYDVATAEGRVKAADEWFARQVAEKGFEKDPWLKRQFDRLVRMINNGLRKMGLDIQLSGAEIREMMRAVQKRGLEGPPGDVQVSSVSADLGRTEKDTVTLEQPDGTTLELPTLVNPSESRLRGLLNRSKEKEIRAMIGPDGNVYAWDATLATHADVADFYGFKYQNAKMYEIPEWDFDTKVAEIRGLTEADISAELATVAPIIQETFDVPEAHPTLSAIKGAFKREAVTREAVTRYSNTIRTEVIDRYHPIKALGEVPYQLHRMLGNAHAVIATFLDHGKLAWKDQALMVTEKGQGFLPWLRNLGEDGRNLFYWMAAKRAEKLEAEDRENWLTPDKRRQIYDAVFAGLSPADRAAKERRFEQLNQEFQKWNKNVIAIARQAGLLNHEQINAWMKDYYLPFYRLLEDEVTREEFLKAPHKSKKHIDAQIRRLKGGEEKIGDPIENILRNWAHLIQESQRNIARSAAAEVAIPMGLAEEVPAKELSKVLGSRTVKIWAVKRMGAKRAGKLFDDPDDAQAYADQQTEETGKQYNVVEQKTTSVMFGRKEDFRIVSYQRDGETVYLRVQDPHLFNALSEMNAKAFDSSLLKIFTGAKRLLTAGATFSPAFRIANLLRDTLHTAVVSKSFAPFIDSFRGAVKVWKESPEYVQLMGSGGGFGMGWVESGDPKAMARAIEKIIKREGKDASWRILSTPRKMLSFWEKVGRASEMAARVQLYSNLRLKGETHLKAAFEARDLLDFYLSGASNAVRVMTAVTPFLNARMQGLDRMYRGAKANPAGFMVKGATVAGASLMLWALFKDDDRYKELEDWEKWQYHHFWIGPHHFRIPKAFEVGAVFSSLFETAANVMTGQEEFKFFGRFLAHSLTETFAVNMPAAFGPTIEVFANRSLFTGRPIESMGLQRLPEGKRAKPWTPEILKGLGEGLNISPLKMQHILLGHTATFGSMFLTAADSMYRLASDAPAKPSMRVEQTPALGRFVRGDARATKYATRYYEISREIDELVGTINYYRRLGDFEAARDLVTEKRALYTQRRIASNVDSQLRRLRRKEEMVWASRALSPKDKRLQLDAIVAQENTIYKTAYERLSP